MQLGWNALIPIDQKCHQQANPCPYWGEVGLFVAHWLMKEWLTRRQGGPGEMHRSCSAFVSTPPPNPPASARQLAPWPSSLTLVLTPISARALNSHKLETSNHQNVTTWFWVITQRQDVSTFWIIPTSHEISFFRGYADIATLATGQQGSFLSGFPPVNRLEDQASSSPNPHWTCQGFLLTLRLTAGF